MATREWRRTIIVVLAVAAAGSWPLVYAASADDVPKLSLQFHKKPDDEVKAPTMRFGILLPGIKNPNRPGQDKKLTFDPMGRTSNTCLKVDGDERLVGFPPGRWQTMAEQLFDKQENRGVRSVWHYPEERLTITQTVTVGRGDQSFDMDTCHVLYAIENKDTRAHDVGLRALLDTYIGTNDGAPFIIPGEKELCETTREYRSSDKVPDFVQALESLDFKKPGVVAHVGLKLAGPVEPPDRLTLCSWPHPLLKVKGALGSMTMWQVPVVSIRKSQDSAAVLYWEPRRLEPGDKRLLGFTYGLGHFSTNDSGDLGLILAGTFKTGTDLTVLALVKKPLLDQTLTLRLSEGLERAGGAETQIVPLPPEKASPVGPVTWKVRAPRPGLFAVGIESSTGSLHAQGLKVNEKSLPR
jgi:hypothetical protein